MKYIDSQEALSEILPKIQASPWAAVDTEADSLHHYVEKLCLLQITIPGEDYVIDPLKSFDLAALVKCLEKKPVILHGADFDIRILKRFYNFLPENVFDTMIAAQLLGYDKQGFADLAKKHCDVELSKKAQRADWSERPLTDELLAYAANDTHYLKAIADIMREELIQSGRLEWHRQFCERVVRSATAEREAKNALGLDWQIKGAKDLKPPALTILKELWLWREEEARRKDRPTFKVLHSDTLLQIADWASKQESPNVADLPNAPRNIKNELKDTLNQIIRRARALPPTEFTAKKPKEGHKRWTNKAEMLLKRLKEERELMAKEYKVQPSLLATNAVLEEFAMAPPADPSQMTGKDLLMPWQAQVTGERILKILQAKV